MHPSPTPRLRPWLSLLRLGLVALATLFFLNAATSAAVALILLRGRRPSIEVDVGPAEAMIAVVVGAVSFWACLRGVAAINRRLKAPGSNRRI